MSPNYFKLTYFAMNTIIIIIGLIMIKQVIVWQVFLCFLFFYFEIEGQSTNAKNELNHITMHPLGGEVEAPQVCHTAT